MKTSDLDYYLPPEQIAQTPVEPRDSSRLLVLSRSSNVTEHRYFRDIGAYLNPGDVLVFNQTRVIPARLRGRKIPSGGQIEFLLLQREGNQTWRGLIGGRRIKKGARLIFEGADGTCIEGTITEEKENAERVICFDSPISPLLTKLGEVPLPPYIHEPLDDPERYQTVYAREPGSAAAPTAGLHFTPELLLKLREQNIRMAYCTLHIGLDTFLPVREEQLEDHKMHTERAILNSDNARVINEARLSGKRIVAVGTTSVRVLETAALSSMQIGNTHVNTEETCACRPVIAIDKATNLFIQPGYHFRAVDAMITNFHLPRSTLLALVSAFAGHEVILNTYRTAQQNGYRFYSFGDAMLLI